MDRLDAMSLLLEVIDSGSFSAAGRRLGMPLATVSRRISDLERHLQTRLLTRTSRKVALTEAGRSYVVACRRILESVDEAERAAAGEYATPKGELILTAPIVFGRLHVLPVVTQFLSAYPDINIRIIFADRLVDLVDDHVDIAVRIGALPDSNLIARSIGVIRTIACASPGYLDVRGRPTVPAELTQHETIAFEGALSARDWGFQNSETHVVVSLSPRLIVNTAEAAVDAAIAGAGVTRVLSYQVADAVRAGKLEIILRPFEPAPWPVNLVHASQGLVPQKLRAFMDFAAPRLRARLDAMG
ncbi:LysR family transcriptional regulator [Bosea psychrotolerans]|uniref:LysR family transcriptional regulator n=1 Tax=Bosea psychrotolerans TaxID=1871628 RepID=A0A2S4M7X3_9HYPH|nr:LysR family transcriptional regulator [Bosea psychrotolerans]POR50843.1 LysR family transcriptional regulator [Bosea psychrotolerans]